MTWFENWFGSPYYKLLYQNRDEQEAQNFVEKLLHYLQPPAGCRMLDIACGEGRFARQLASHGFDVTGIDISAASIMAAKEQEAEHLSFFVHDMRFPFYINYFDYAFNFFTSFGYFAHNRDNALAAKAFTAGLKAGGVLVIDYLNRDFVVANLVEEETILRGNTSFHIQRKFERNHIVKNITVSNPDGTTVSFRESVSAFTAADFDHLLQPCGMQLIATFGDYRLGAYNAASSPRLIMVYRKNDA